MNRPRSLFAVLLCSLIFARPALAADEVMPGTAKLESRTGLPVQIAKQWDNYLLGQIEKARTERPRFWQRDHSSAAAYARSLAPNRERLKRMIGAIDERVAFSELQVVTTFGQPPLRAETAAYVTHEVRWPVFLDVHGEGLLLVPKGEIKACVVALPDADHTPEMLAGLNPGIAPDSQYARRLAENGCVVLIPTLLDRRTRWSGDERLKVYTDITHREWIYRQAGDVGRHPIGYEVQKVQAAVDWFCSPGGPSKGLRVPVAVAGYGEGGLLALFAAAIDERIDASWVSGYFQPRERLWQEPLYRNLWGFLLEFGDAELASMIAPRTLVVEHSRFPEVTHPSLPDPAHKKVNKVAGRGRVVTPDKQVVAAEFERAKSLVAPHERQLHFVAEPDADFGSEGSLRLLARALGISSLDALPAKFTRSRPFSTAEIDARQHRQVRELQEFTQERIRLAEYEREKFFWDKLDVKGPEQWDKGVQRFRDYFWNEVIGRFPAPDVTLSPRSRLRLDLSEAQFTTYEVILDVRAGVETWGLVSVPKDLRPGERRPVVVCQHGAGSDPESTFDLKSPSYHAYARQLARFGFVTYSPYNPNKATLGEDFRQLQRKGNPLKKTVYGIFAANHQRVLEWLRQQAFVDPRRIAFYGLSYGGKTAMRVPVVLDYCLSICSGDFNDYLQKVTSVRSDKNPFTFVDSYENVQFNLGNTFNYAEMAAMIAPRPFMVEHGYQDRVAPLEWASAQYARVRKLYFRLGIPERTGMAIFDGPHMIHGEESFRFLQQQLQWPAR